MGRSSIATIPPSAPVEGGGGGWDLSWTIRYAYDDRQTLVRRQAYDGLGELLDDTRFLVESRNPTGYSQVLGVMDGETGRLEAVNTFTAGLAAQRRVYIPKAGSAQQRPAAPNSVLQLREGLVYSTGGGVQSRFRSAAGSPKVRRSSYSQDGATGRGESEPSFRFADVVSPFRSDVGRRARRSLCSSWDRKRLGDTGFEARRREGARIAPTLGGAWTGHLGRGSQRSLCPRLEQSAFQALGGFHQDATARGEQAERLR